MKINLGFTSIDLKWPPPKGGLCFVSRSTVEAAISFVSAFFLAYLLIIKADPLGFDAATKNHAQRVFYQIVGASRTLTQWLYSEPGAR